jgi:C1A family cysteine protease
LFVFFLFVFFLFVFFLFVPGHHFTNYGAGGPACGQEGASPEKVCSKFDPKKGKDDPIVMFGRSKLPVAEQGGGHAAGHAISILGWHCENHPSCDKGSWLIQNSWGHAWGDNGVGWISFTSLDIENQIYFIDVAGVCK